jgi:hypothetical protein
MVLALALCSFLLRPSAGKLAPAGAGTPSHRQAERGPWHARNLLAPTEPVKTVPEWQELAKDRVKWRKMLKSIKIWR